MTDFNRAILAAAGEHMGTKEWPGAKHNPDIVAMFAAAGHAHVKDDETPWCAAFMNAVLAQLGLPGTGKLNARSFLEWGHSVALEKALPGDVAILWRGSPTSWQGHVGIVVSVGGDTITLRGGNQGNRVSDQAYPIARLLAIRRYIPVTEPQTGRPTLRAGNTAPIAAVRELQADLATLGYFSGAIDGVFGSRTKAAVIAFQSESGLAVDGIVGSRTWSAMASAEPRTERNVSLDDLRDRGSSTIRNLDIAEVGTVVAGGAAAVREMGDTVAEASGVLGKITETVVANWPALAVIATVVVLALVLTNRMKSTRLKDARTGAHVGR